MYLQKGTQFHGANENDELYKGIMVFMITGLKKKKTKKKTVPSVFKACPEVTVNGEWLSQEILKCIFQLINSGFFLLGLLLQTIIQPM